MTQRTQYNDNIELCYKVGGIQHHGKLTDKQYYALMVIDWQVSDNGGKTDHGDRRKFWNKKAGEMGLECTSDDRVYISKNYNQRHQMERGDTWVVSVADPTLCRILGEELHPCDECGSPSITGCGCG
jgi:hypothetical protein